MRKYLCFICCFIFFFTGCSFTEIKKTIVTDGTKIKETIVTEGKKILSDIRKASGEKPGKTPVTKAGKTPVAKAGKTPVVKPVNTPVAKAGKTPVVKPVNTPVAKAVNTPAAKPVKTSVAQAKPSPVEVSTKDPIFSHIHNLRNGQPMSRAVRVPKNYMSDEYSLVRYLTEGLDDYEKAKVLHDWIALNIEYDAESYFSGNYPPMDSKSVLKRRTAVCEGFSSLYQRFCELAGLKCFKISGVAKGYGYSAGGSLGPHAWNAVQIGNMCYLLDSTWDGGYLEGRTYVKQYSTDYLFLGPACFIYSHFPDEPAWQLLGSPVTKEQFESLPDANGKFFSFGLSLVSPGTYKNTVDGEFEARIKAPQNVFLSATIDDGKKKFENYTLLQKDSNEYILKARFPRKGVTYNVTVYGKSGKSQENYTGILNFLVYPKNKSTSFPATYSTFTDYGCYLYAPLEGHIKRGNVYFKCRVRDAGAVAVVIDGNFTPLSSQGNDIYEGTVQVSGRKCSINMMVPGDNRYWSLAEYNIIP
ncbi:MAG: transglutaminase domain-containing protein [Candidatus Eremiobacterota bacterium]